MYIFLYALPKFMSVYQLGICPTSVALTSIPRIWRVLPIITKAIAWDYCNNLYYITKMLYSKQYS